MQTSILAKGPNQGKFALLLIVQCQDLLDAHHPSTLIIPLTTNLIDDAEPLRVRIPAGKGLKKESDLLIDQLRAIDNKRLINRPLLNCPDSIMNLVDRCLIEILGFDF